MATTGNITLTWSLIVRVFLSLVHTLSYPHTHSDEKKAPNSFRQQDCAYPQPSNNLLPSVWHKSVTKSRASKSNVRYNTEK